MNFHYQIRPILMSTYITEISVIFSFIFPNLKYSYGNHALSRKYCVVDNAFMIFENYIMAINTIIAIFPDLLH